MAKKDNRTLPNSIECFVVIKSPPGQVLPRVGMTGFVEQSQVFHESVVLNNVFWDDASPYYGSSSPNRIRSEYVKFISLGEYELRKRLSHKLMEHLIATIPYGTDYPEFFDVNKYFGAPYEALTFRNGVPIPDKNEKFVRPRMNKIRKPKAD